MDVLSGHYNWIYANGQFPVCLRSNGVFSCPKVLSLIVLSISFHHH